MEFTEELSGFGAAAVLIAEDRGHLFRRIAWRLQALAEGDLSERARTRAHQIARDADLRTVALRVPWAVNPSGRLAGTGIAGNRIAACPCRVRCSAGSGKDRRFWSRFATGPKGLTCSFLRRTVAIDC